MSFFSQVSTFPFSQVSGVPNAGTSGRRFWRSHERPVEEPRFSDFRATRRYCEARSFGGASHLEGVYKAFVYRGTQRNLSLLSFVRASQELTAKDPAFGPSFGALLMFASVVFSCLLLFIYSFNHYTRKGPYERVLHGGTSYTKHALLYSRNKNNNKGKIKQDGSNCKGK